MIKAFIAWLHRITAPPVEVEVMVGDVWVHEQDGPWAGGYEVREIAEGWVRYKVPNSDVLRSSPIDRFRRYRRLKSRNGVPQ